MEAGIISDKKIYDRLSVFFMATGWSKAEFARRMDISPQNVNLYLSGDLKLGNIVSNLLNEGCSLDWLYGHSSEMFADNNAGRTMAAKQIIKDDYTDTVIKNIKKWISEKQHSLAAMCEKYIFDEKTIKKALEKGDLKSISYMYDCLRAADCNIEWLTDTSLPMLFSEAEEIRKAEKTTADNEDLIQRIIQEIKDPIIKEIKKSNT